MRNPQSLKGARKRARAPKQRKAARQHHSKKMEINGMVFDSQTEGLFYVHLLKDPAVKDIELQPEYQIIEPYTVTCKRCGGSGKRPSPKTGNLINCNLCHGKRKRQKAGAVYTADFKVTYIDGYQEVIDVKGYKAERDFSLRKKLFEQQTGVELIVVRMKGKEWVRD